jgi:hypothetical protein
MDIFSGRLAPYPAAKRLSKSYILASALPSWSHCTLAMVADRNRVSTRLSVSRRRRHAASFCVHHLLECSRAVAVCLCPCSLCS